MKRAIFAVVLVLVLVQAATEPALAEKAGEDLVILPPAAGNEWKLGYEAGEEGGGTRLHEYVKKASGETVDNWTELLSVTINIGLQKKTDAYAFAEGMLGLSKAQCPNGFTVARLERQGSEALSQWAIKGCSGFFPAQTTLLRTFATRDALCSVQYAWKAPPTPEAVKKAMELIQKVRITEAP